MDQHRLGPRVAQAAPLGIHEEEILRLRRAGNEVNQVPGPRGSPLRERDR